MTPTSIRPRLLVAATAGLASILAGVVVATPAHAAAASITAPTTADAGSLAVFSGSNWPAYATVNTYLVKSSSSFFCSLHADSSGVIAAQTCAVPTYLIAGSYTVHADDTHGHTDDAASPLKITPATTLTSTFNSAPNFHVAAGSTAGVGGHGFAPSSALTVKLGATTVATSPAAPTSDTNGTFNPITFTVPAGQAAGPLVVKVTDASSNTSSHSLQVYRAALTAPATVLSGGPVVLSGTGWPGDDTVTLYFGHNGSNTFMCSVHSNDAGAIAQSSCASPGNLPAGSYSLIASDTAVTVSRPISVTANFAAYSTFNSLLAPAVASGSTLSLAGHGYAASSPLSVELGSTTLATTPVSATTDTNGTFSNVVVTIPATQTPARVTLTVTDGAGNSHAFKLSTFRAKVTAPTAGPAGVSQLVSGTGWPPTDAVTAYLHYGTSNGFLCTLHSDDDGVIAPQSCPMPTYLPAGAYSILLSDGYVTASKAFTMQSAISVTNTSGQPLAGATVGTAVNLTGYGFTATSAITVKLGTKTISTVPASPVTTSAGGFSGVTFAVPNIAAGTYTLAVTDGAGKKGTALFTVS